MKRLLITIIAWLGLATLPAFAGVFTVTAPGPLNSSAIGFNIANNDGFDLLRVTFDLSNTHSLAPGNPPLVFGGAFGLSGPAGGTAVGFGVQNDLQFGFDFTSFNTGDSFSFSWDPDIATDAAYGAVVSELAGTMVTLLTTGGTVSGALQINRTQDGLIAIIASPAPEPMSLALIGVALAALGVVRRRRAV